MFKTIMEKLQNTKFYNKLMDIMESFGFSSLWETLEKKADEVINNTDITDTVGGKIQKFMAKTFKKFSAWWTKDNNAFKKLLGVIGKVIAIVSVMAFMTLVLYILVKILPQLIITAAFFFAVLIGIKLITGIIGKAINVQ